ncbi:hypothetical protein GCM10011575_44480 [Microlunatus endophyticus]|uniref:Type II secretion system protein GspF domain-containing protein n=1 Tax=Microlunatus endophyticus TaxID=1716077 RepID=A0A917SI88_9ACTN|nr:type II secretion system F family protein [Microlunatus endophyticus]GGL81295.1 hypothetical protein GCM10011575_44480 [Microlunatus endophyticus]
MIIISVLLAGIAGLLWFRTPPVRSLRRRLATIGQATAERSPTAGLRGLLPVVCAAGALTGSGLAFGAQGFWLCAPAVIIAATVARLVRAGVRRARAAAARQQVAQACSVLATQVRIGQPPLVAIRSAAEDCPVLRPAVAIVELGGDPTAAWCGTAKSPGHEGLAELARVWQVANRTGADLADALDRAADGLFDDDAVALVVASEAAGPRASGKIMAVLPVAGLGIGYAIGGDPLQFLTSSPYGWGCLVAGTVLACGGVLWMERVADRAAL